MRNLAGLLIFVLPLLACPAPALEELNLGKGLTIVRGAVNGALLKRGEKILAVYGDPREKPAPVDTVLFTHHRRDVVWAGRALVERGARAVVPAREAVYFRDVEQLWKKFATSRFHDYSQQTTKILTRSLNVERTIQGGETLQWEGIPIRVLDTPGYTRGAVSYLLELDGKKIAFTGDLIQSGGRLLDLYSLQDAIPEATIGGYHGYAARLGQMVESLRRVAAEEPSVLVPARGPVINEPGKAISGLIERIQTLYSNYLSIDALRWYFGDGHILAKAKRVLDPSAKVDWMEMAEIMEKLPSWIIPINNSRLIVSGDGTGFQVDCGSRGIINKLKDLGEEGKFKEIEYLFITHYHDDHTDQVGAFVEEFGAAVFASRVCRDVLENPAAYRLPAMTANPIHLSGRYESGATWRWKEFELTCYYFPGQTLYHDALLVKRDGGEGILFVGDSFTPSGIDDYCLLNRNFLHPGRGYFYCLDLIRRLDPGCFLINQHVGPAFRFSHDQIRRMETVLKRRVEILRDLFPWEDPNQGLDEGWARFYPYGCRVRRGETARWVLRILNHSPRTRRYGVRFHLPPGWTREGSAPTSIPIPPGQEGAVELKVAPPPGAEPGQYLFTADLRWGEWELREWSEAMVEVVP